MQFVVKQTNTNTWAHLWDVAIQMKDCHPSLTLERVCSTLPNMVRIFGYENTVRGSGDVIHIHLLANVESVMKFMSVLEWLQNPNVH
jgi:hypothetical protein